jgi:transcriptional regulator with XRE-family HTH domain
MKNEKYIQRAINLYFEQESSSALDLSKRLGVSNSTTARWANGKASTIRNSHWVQLYPIIRKYIPDDRINAMNNDTSLYEISNSNIQETIKFSGSEIQTVEKDGVVYTAMKPIVEGMGLDWHKQFELINRDGVLSTTVTIMGMVAEDGKQRDMVCLPLTYLNGWLFKINASRYQGERRDAIIKYQRECYEVLHDYWHKGEAKNPRYDLEAENRILKLELEKSELTMKQISVFAAKGEFGEISDLTGKERCIPVRGYYRTGKPKNQTVSDVLQMFFEFNQ